MNINNEFEKAMNGAADAAKDAFSKKREKRIKRQVAE